MAKRLLIIITNADPECAITVATPLRQALMAAQLNYSTEVVFTGRSGCLALDGIAASIPLPGEPERSLYDLIRDAHEAKVTFKVCAPALEGRVDQRVLDEIAETVGGAYIVCEAMETDTVTLTY